MNALLFALTAMMASPLPQLKIPLVDDNFTIKIEYTAGFPYAPDPNGRMCFPKDIYKIDIKGINFERHCSRYPENNKDEVEKRAQITIGTALRSAPNLIDVLSATLTRNIDPQKADLWSPVGDDSRVDVEFQNFGKVKSYRGMREAPQLDPIILSLLEAIETIEM